MTERKITDEDVIKALECCSKDGMLNCRNCPYEASCDMGGSEMQRDALDLIKRQRAEIERLQKYNTDVAFKHYNDGIKEFAERVKEIKVKYALPLLGLQTKDEIERYVDDILLQMRDGIDKLVKEMTEGEQ